jgi:hypothetical protein
VSRMTLDEVAVPIDDDEAVLAILAGRHVA